VGSSTWHGLICRFFGYSWIARSRAEPAHVRDVHDGTFAPIVLVRYAVHALLAFHVGMEIGGGGSTSRLLVRSASQIRHEEIRLVEVEESRRGSSRESAELRMLVVVIPRFVAFDRAGFPTPRSSCRSGKVVPPTASRISMFAPSACDRQRPSGEFHIARSAGFRAGRADLLAEIARRDDALASETR